MVSPLDMQKFLDGASIAPEVSELRPDYRVVLLAVDGIIPGPSDENSEKLLREAESAARAALAKHPVTEIPHVAAWREAYKAFGAKPNKYRNSLEALTRRVEAGLPRVNRLTDIYNAVSVKHQIPLGGEDLRKYNGPPRLIRSTGKEEFEVKAGGEIVKEYPDVGEVVWVDDAGVTCRRWNWRQGPRTALTDDTTTAIFICDALGAMSDNELDTMVSELVKELENLGPDVKVLRRTIAASAKQ